MADDPNADLEFGFLSELTAIHFPTNAVYIIINMSAVASGGPSGGRIPPNVTIDIPHEPGGDSGGGPVANPTGLIGGFPKSTTIPDKSIDEGSDNTTFSAIDMTIAPNIVGLQPPNVYGLWTSTNVTATFNEIAFQTGNSQAPPQTPCPAADAAIFTALANVHSFDGNDAKAVTITDYSSHLTNAWLVMIPVSAAGKTFSFTVTCENPQDPSEGLPTMHCGIEIFSTDLNFKPLKANIKTFERLAQITGSFADATISKEQSAMGEFQITATLQQSKPFTLWKLAGGHFS